MLIPCGNARDSTVPKQSNEVLRSVIRTQDVIHKVNPIDSFKLLTRYLLINVGGLSAYL